MTVIRRNLQNKIMVEHKTDLLNHPYFILPKIQELDWQSKRLEKKIQILNIYNNRVKQRCIWIRRNSCIKRVLKIIK